MVHKNLITVAWATKRHHCKGLALNAQPYPHLDIEHAPIKTAAGHKIEPGMQLICIRPRLAMEKICSLFNNPI